MIGVNIDISERKRAEQSLLDSEARLRRAIEAARMSVWERDMQTGLHDLYGSSGSYMDSTQTQLWWPMRPFLGWFTQMTGRRL